MITFKKNQYDNQMDSEVIELCDAMNCMPGIRTTGSCCGHGKERLMIFFEVRDPVVGIFFMARCVDKRYFKHGDTWDIRITVGDTIGDGGYLPTAYVLESTHKGEEAYKEAKDLVANIVQHLNHKNFLKGYFIDLGKFDVEGEELGDDWWEVIQKATKNAE